MEQYRKDSNINTYVKNREVSSKNMGKGSKY